MNVEKIMIVDDEDDILDLLEKALLAEGFQNIIKVANGKDAVEICRTQRPALIVLDIMLPDLDGYEVCKKIRAFSHCPILFLSARNDELDKVLGLAVGGDDYVTKPFSLKEVVYRIKAQLRRLGYQKNLAQSELLKIGALTFDIDACRAFKNDVSLKLTAKELNILLYLADNLGRVISRERLYEAVWQADGFGCDNIIMVHIRRLRKKLEENPAQPKYLLTVKGFGYKLVNPNES